MSAKRQMLVDLKTGKVRPAIPRTPVLSSAGKPWQNLLLEEFHGGPLELMDVAAPPHVLRIQLRQTVVREIKCGSEQFRPVRTEPGQVTIYPAMVPFSTRTNDTGDFLALTLDPKFLFCATREMVRSDRFELIPKTSVDDPLLRAIIMAIQAETAADHPGGQIYVETLANTVAAHLVRHYSSAVAVPFSQHASLSRNQLRRVIDHIHDHLSEMIPLSALASVAGLSAFHFARLFKQTTGLAPHQFLIKCRLEKARQLLLVDDPGIADVALQVGFCGQSHFAAHFKRIYGLTPRTFARRMGRHRLSSKPYDLSTSAVGPLHTAPSPFPFHSGTAASRRKSANPALPVALKKV